MKDFVNDTAMYTHELQPWPHGASFLDALT